MSLTYQVLAFVGLSFGWFSFYSWNRKKRMDHMYMMIIGMSMGMMIGLIAGLLFGGVYKGDLFLSTIWGMLIGGISGMIIGIPLSLLSTIEGTLSGIMAGMMGAMLGEMIPMEKMEPLLFLFIMLYTGCILLLSNLIESSEGDTPKRKWLITLNNPIAPAVLLIGVFIWFQTLPFSIMSAENDQMHSQNHMSQPVVQEVNIIASDFSYKPNRIVMKKGVPMKVKFQNVGSVEHDFEVVSSGKFVISSESNHNHQHGNTGKANPHLHAKPGESATSVWQATEEGNYEYYCTIPGHKESGMVGRLVVL
ncbi:plastocyanin/azurin family copper-binding protein [Brevibacillus agri]|uniref:cupredoxin domain-containing protein n=1 Tax=Brevibacillus TaxID=55080 RepID=UPI0020417B9C|nr:MULTISPECIES: plastocyanin/azurin family copper-binding protein [Brevibacillus]MCM3431713.1 plastocyanin/azurin family copper-binding protein [Brevibacillus invocatus]MED1645880.1 plastocyanin/azurin family copper-binding protein [Brevibacillus agri]MED1657577.1 plastocyanin/azurin family copper-binding protein [Brevibacillus agri]MED1690069.1 plastocyanin/azurin family copper-binding protein [Brevibacillus agri]MED1694014.1 plastocyanin/azurin family copper-binding protein [Brevibacillus a